MNKKADTENLIVWGIVLLVVLAFAIVFFTNASSFFSGKSNEAAVHTWVIARGVEVNTAKIPNLVGVQIFDDRPPVIGLDTPIKIENENNLLYDGNKPPKLFKDLSDSMVDCWNAFDNGKTDFMNAIGKDTFCFKCRAVLFSDDIKRKSIPIVGFNAYLNNTKTRNTNSPTYLQYLANDKEKQLVLSQEDLIDDKIYSDENLYIIFFASSGRGIVNIITNVLGAGDVVPEETSENKIYKPTDVQAPQYKNLDLFTASEKSEAAIVGTGTLAAGRYYLPKLAEKQAKILATGTAETTARAAAQLGAELDLSLGINKATLEVAKDSSKTLVLEVAAKGATGEAVKKTVEKSLMKRLAINIGAKVISGPVGWLAIAGTSVYGIHQITVGEKPFISKVMLIDSKGYNKLCNA